MRVSEAIKAHLQEKFDAQHFDVQVKYNGDKGKAFIRWYDGPTVKGVSDHMIKFPDPMFKDCQYQRVLRPAFLKECLDSLVQQLGYKPLSVVAGVNPYDATQIEIQQDIFVPLSALHDVIVIPIQATVGPVDDVRIKKLHNPSKNIWYIYGDTYPHRDRMKEAGGKWSGQYQAWVFDKDPGTLDQQCLYASLPAPEPVTPRPAAQRPPSTGGNRAQQTIANQLRDKADGMTKTIETKLNPAIGQQRPTRRRMNIAGSMVSEGFRLKAIQDKLYALADAWEKNAVPISLRRIRTIRVVELLSSSTAPYPENKSAWASLRKVGIIHSARWTQAADELNTLREQWQQSGNAPAPTIDPVQIEIDQKIRELVGKKIDGFFPTPEAIVDMMIEAAKASSGNYKRILEPSAGKGDIADKLVKAFPQAQVDCIEPVYSLREILTLKGHTLIEHDVLKHEVSAVPITSGVTRQYDLVVMNPPYEKNQDIEHVMHCYNNLLKPGGVIVALVSAGTMAPNSAIKVRQRWQEFYTSLKEHGWAADKQLPENSFISSFRPTGVNIFMLVIQKPVDSRPITNYKVTNPFAKPQDVTVSCSPRRPSIATPLGWDKSAPQRSPAATAATAATAPTSAPMQQQPSNNGSRIDPSNLPPALQPLATDPTSPDPMHKDNIMARFKSMVNEFMSSPGSFDDLVKTIGEDDEVVETLRDFAQNHDDQEGRYARMLVQAIDSIEPEAQDVTPVERVAITMGLQTIIEPTLPPQVQAQRSLIQYHKILVQYRLERRPEAEIDEVMSRITATKTQLQNGSL